MLPKKYRLPAYQIPLTLKKGRYIHCQFFTLIIHHPSTPADGQTSINHHPSRFAVIVSKKLAKQAVIRNRVKRRILEIIRWNLKNIKNNYIVIFLAKKPLMLQKFSLIKTEIENTMKKANLIKE